MHILLILILLWLAFPAFTRMVGGLLSVLFWLILIGAVLGLIGVFSH